MEILEGKNSIACSLRMKFPGARSGNRARPRFSESESFRAPLNTHEDRFPVFDLSIVV